MDPAAWSSTLTPMAWILECAAGFATIPIAYSNGFDR
jgi:hypothetical protein